MTKTQARTELFEIMGQLEDNEICLAVAVEQLLALIQRIYARENL